MWRAAGEMGGSYLAYVLAAKGRDHWGKLGPLKMAPKTTLAARGPKGAIATTATAKCRSSV